MSKFNILLVDDVPENIHSLQMMIEDAYDVNIYTALSAQEGMEILMKENVDLILSDVQMPDIDGFEFAEYLKGIEKTKDIPIIFITGIYDKDEYKTKGYSLGAVEYITKPIDDILLNSKLNVYIDIFEKSKKNQEELEKKNEILIHQAKMATMGEMIGVIAHQLKQPINILSLFCEDVKYSHMFGTIDDAFIEDFSKNTAEQIEFLSNTVENFRDFFNPNKTKMQFPLKTCIDKSLSLLLKQVEKNEVNLEINVPEDNLVFGVDTELEQVILNLISNSIDAFNDRNIEDRKITMKSITKQNYTIFSFEDNAGGIPEESIEKIFDPYFTTKEQGTGTGLYMVNLVVKTSFKGELKVLNTGSGLKYTLALPTTEDA